MTGTQEAQKLTNRRNDLAQIVATIPEQHIAAESELLLTKWPAYRFMTPLAATRLFADLFVDHYKRFIRENEDVELAAKKNPLANWSAKTRNRLNTSLWLARQHADSLGLPYDAYLRFAFDFAARRQRKAPPMPNQIGPSKKTHSAWAAKFAEWWTDEERELWESREPPLSQYFTGNNAGTSLQKFYVDQLLASLGDVPDGPLVASIVEYYIHRLRVLRREHLTEAKGVTEKSEYFDIAERRFMSSGMDPIEYEPVDRVDLLPSCFGLPGARSEASAPCSSCSHREVCERFAGFVVKSVEDTYGVSDPVKEKELAQNRARVQKHRNKKKAAAVTHVAASFMFDLDFLNDLM